jgi:hypothetical protein
VARRVQPGFSRPESGRLGRFRGLRVGGQREREQAEGRSSKDHMQLKSAYPIGAARHSAAHPLDNGR